MARYSALLRGINVGGINIKMTDLRDVFSSLGFTEVRTVLASGNVLFDAPTSDSRGLKETIESALADRFGFDAWVFVLDLRVVETIVAAYPFEPDREGWHAYVVFVDGAEPLRELLEGSADFDPAEEQVQSGDGVVYWEVERGHTLKSRFGKTSGKSKFKAVTTTRNIRTLQKLLK